VILRWLLLAAILLALILVPFALFEDSMTAWARDFLMRPQASWILASGIAALLAGDLLLPVPSSIVSTAAGALLGFAAGTLASWAGMTAGCVLGYWLGVRAAREPARRILGEAEMLRMVRAQRRWGAWTVLLLRPIPVLAEASVVYAGMGALPFHRFLALTAAANLAISAVYAYLGAFLGANWR
jgi:uncharacterized membrane protein YdjX (TVP38/TMEM64 family)